MWFITDENPALPVRINDSRTVLFVAGEYRTDDAEEIAVLKKDKRVHVASEGAQADALMLGFAVNTNTGELHDLSKAGQRCHIPADVEHATGWKVYKRMSDAVRWNKGLSTCAFCMKGLELEAPAAVEEEPPSTYPEASPNFPW